jgi:hypothetical protein
MMYQCTRNKNRYNVLELQQLELEQGSQARLKIKRIFYL